MKALPTSATTAFPEQQALVAAMPNPPAPGSPRSLQLHQSTQGSLGTEASASPGVGPGTLSVTGSGTVTDPDSFTNSFAAAATSRSLAATHGASSSSSQVDVASWDSGRLGAALERYKQTRERLSWYYQKKIGEDELRRVRREQHLAHVASRSRTGLLQLTGGAPGLEQDPAGGGASREHPGIPLFLGTNLQELKTAFAEDHHASHAHGGGVGGGRNLRVCAVPTKGGVAELPSVSRNRPGSSGRPQSAGGDRSTEAGSRNPSRPPSRGGAGGGTARAASYVGFLGRSESAGFKA